MASSEKLKSESVRIYWQDALRNSMRMVDEIEPSQQDDKPACSFIHFPKLPIELRLKIWKLALPDTRTITLKEYQAEIPHIEPYGYTKGAIIYQLRVRAIASTPVLLHTSRESRGLALGFYKLSLACLLHGRPIYIDYLRDAVYVEHSSTLNVLESCARRNGDKAEQELEDMERRLRCLIINTITDQYFPFHREHGVSKFNRLQTLIFVFEGYSSIPDWRPGNSWRRDQLIFSRFKRNKNPVHLVQIIRKLERLWEALRISSTEFPEILIGENAEDGEFIIHTCTVSILPSHLLHLANLSIQESVRSQLEHLRGWS
jgi:hypothetical protein